jgi:CTP synthase
VHPYYVATQAHPELSSRPTRPHPLFAGLVKAALEHQAGANVLDTPQTGSDTAAAAEPDAGTATGPSETATAAGAPEARQSRTVAAK